MSKNEMRSSESSSPILAYSLRASMALDLFLAFFLFVVAFYYLLISGALTATFILSALFFFDFYYRLWRRRIRRAHFYDDHFEISGRGVTKSANYDEIESFTKVRSLAGDFRTDSTVLLSIRDVPDVLRMPNRRNRRLKLDVYSLLLQRAPERASQMS